MWSNILKCDYSFINLFGAKYMGEESPFFCPRPHLHKRECELTHVTTTMCFTNKRMNSRENIRFWILMQHNQCNMWNMNLRIFLNIWYISIAKMSHSWRSLLRHPKANVMHLIFVFISSHSIQVESTPRLYSSTVTKSMTKWQL